MSIISSTDLSVRLQKISCSYKDEVVKLIESYAYGLPCVDKENTAIIVTYLIDLLKCYDTSGTTEDELDTLNCVTYSELNNILDYLSKKLEICFEPFGAEYVLPDTSIITSYTTLLGENPGKTPTLENGDGIASEPIYTRK